MLTSLDFHGSDWTVGVADLDPSFLADLLDCATPGQSADESVAYLCANYAISGDVADCAAYLKGYGAWDDAELADHSANLQRLVWLVAGDLRETGEACLSTY